MIGELIYVPLPLQSRMDGKNATRIAEEVLISCSLEYFFRFWEKTLILLEIFFEF